MKRPTKLQIKLLSLIIEDEGIMISLERAGFDLEIQKLIDLGYIENHELLSLKTLTDDVLDADFEVQGYVYNKDNLA